MSTFTTVPKENTEEKLDALNKRLEDTLRRKAEEARTQGVQFRIPKMSADEAARGGPSRQALEQAAFESLKRSRDLVEGD